VLWKILQRLFRAACCWSARQEFRVTIAREKAGKKRERESDQDPSSQPQKRISAAPKPSSNSEIAAASSSRGTKRALRSASVEKSGGNKKRVKESDTKKKSDQQITKMVEGDFVVPSSAASALFLLDEPAPELQTYALKTLNALADSFWPEISPCVVKIQALSEDKAFPSAELAALVASKVLFHLGELEEALTYALSAGSLFDVSATSQFALTLRAKCIDEYIRVQIASFDLKASVASAGTSSTSTTPADLVLPEGLESVVERILDDCVARGEVREALGVAIESRRLDRMESAIIEGCKTPAHRAAALLYCFDCVQGLVAHRAYRGQVLRLVADLHRREPIPDEAGIARCLAFTENSRGVADCLIRLLDSKDKKNELIAYQIAFDIYDNDAPHFASSVASLLPSPPVAILPSNTSAPESGAGAQDLDEATKQVAKLRAILSGVVPAALSLEFLYSQCQSDMYILKSMKSALDTRSSLCHSSLIFANAVAHAGTTVDTFLRENLDWLARATSWSKFSATACLGVIHSRHTASSMTILSPYLSSTPGVVSSAYAEGGALFALGLISATGGNVSEAGELGLKVLPGKSAPEPSDSVKYLLDALRNASSNEIIQHGACLGLGLSAMASWDGASEENEIYEELKSVLFTDSAVAGEAAGIGMGLVALGSQNERILDEMISYAKETEHEKIKRGLAMGIAMICYAREDEASDLIQKLSKDPDSILRYSAMFATAFAFAGTADNQAIRLLLHTAVSDVNDDVRRGAVIALGFVLMRHPKQVPKTIALLAESCHAHVRYGAAIAIGIACAGTGLTSAFEILERLVVDSSDFVRQGASIALALVFMQHSETLSPKVGDVRKLFEKMYTDKHEESMTKFGAVLSNGLIDAGGRNVRVGLLSRSGHRRASGIVGMAMFLQHWFWFPFVHFIGLALKPAAMIGLTSEMKMPKFDVKMNCRPALYAYPKIGPPEKQKKDEKASVMVLSITAKARAREARKKGAHSASDENAMEVDTKADASKPSVSLEGKLAALEVDQKPKEESPSSYTVSNPFRVLADQEVYVSWLSENRFQPIDSALKAGFVMLSDSTPLEPAEYIPLRTRVSETAQGATTAETGPGATSTADSAEGVPEPEPPAAVLYTEEDENQS